MLLVCNFIHFFPLSTLLLLIFSELRSPAVSFFADIHRNVDYVLESCQSISGPPCELHSFKANSQFISTVNQL